MTITIKRDNFFTSEFTALAAATKYLENGTLEQE